MEGRNLFFGEKDLKGYSYILLIDDFNTRINTSGRINQYGGQVTFKISSGSVIVIENNQELYKACLKQELEKYEKTIYLSDGVKVIVKDNKIIANNNEIQNNIFNTKFTSNVSSKVNKVGNLILQNNQINNTNGINPNNKLLRILMLKDLISHMDLLESKSIDPHFKYGLPKEVDRNSTISLVNLRDKRLRFHTFPKIKNNLNAKMNLININLNNVINYDIPIYFQNAPTGFSLFQSKEEKEMIDLWLKKHGNKLKLSKSEEEILKDVKNPQNLPLPRKEHNFCHLCSKRYEEYLSHISCEHHIQNRIKNLENYERINNTFKRIRDFWEERKNQISKIEKEKELNKIICNNNSHLELCSSNFINNNSTKCETNLNNNVVAGNSAYFNLGSIKNTSSIEVPNLIQANLNKNYLVEETNLLNKRNLVGEANSKIDLIIDAGIILEEESISIPNPNPDLNNKFINNFLGKEIKVTSINDGSEEESKCFLNNVNLIENKNNLEVNSEIKINLPLSKRKEESNSKRINQNINQKINLNNSFNNTFDNSFNNSFNNENKNSKVDKNDKKVKNEHSFFVEIENCNDEVNKENKNPENLKLPDNSNNNNIISDNTGELKLKMSFNNINNIHNINNFNNINNLNIKQNASIHNPNNPINSIKFNPSNNSIYSIQNPEEKLSNRKRKSELNINTTNNANNTNNESFTIPHKTFNKKLSAKPNYLHPRDKHIFTSLVKTIDHFHDLMKIALQKNIK